jgi:hypothetical protein
MTVIYDKPGEDPEYGYYLIEQSDGAGLMRLMNI